MRRFYPYLYYLGASKRIYNWTEYFKNNAYGLGHSVFTFWFPIAVFQASNILNSDGHNVDLWSLSLTSFTAVYIVVTVRIIVWTRWWTCTNFLFYSVFSICVYVAYIFISEAIELTLVPFVETTHKSLIYWVTAAFVVGVIFLLETTTEFFRLEYNKNASDYCRMYVINKKKDKDYDPDVGVTVN